MRCLALAQAWRRIGGVAFFAVADQLASVARRIRDEDFEVQLVEELLGSQADAARTCEMANGNDCDWLVLDGYQFRDVTAPADDLTWFLLRKTSRAE